MGLVVDSGGQQSLMITCHPLALSMCVYFNTQIQTLFARKAWSDNQLAAYEEMSYAIVPKVGEDGEAFRMLVGKGRHSQRLQSSEYAVSGRHG